GVHLELRPEGRTVAVVETPDDAKGRAILHALPHHEEVPGSVGGDGGILLYTRRVRVHWEFRPQHATTAVVALAEDAGARTDLSPTTTKFAAPSPATAGTRWSLVV